MITHKLKLSAILLLSLALRVPIASAQTTTRAADANARQTRDQLHQLLDQYSPSLHQVLRLDSSLLRNEAYLAPYPTLAAFLAEHPEVLHSPGYFVGEPNYDRRDEVIPEEVAIGILLLTFTGVGIWLVKTLTEHRRWLRLSKVQTEAHSKLLDRFSANADLLAYIQSPAGRRFLESTPVAFDTSPRRIGAPQSRIVWSVQAGLVAIFGGLGMHFVSNRLIDRSTEVFFVLGSLAMALGLGFVISAFVSYILSRRLGLMNESSLERTSDEHA